MENVEVQVTRISLQGDKTDVLCHLEKLNFNYCIVFNMNRWRMMDLEKRSKNYVQRGRHTDLEDHTSTTSNK